MNELWCRGWLPECARAPHLSPDASWRSDWLGWYCSDECQAIFHKRVKLKEPQDLNCVICGVVFKSSRSNAKYCSKECGIEGNRRNGVERYRKMMAERPETKTQLCAWCGEDIEVHVSYTGSRLYHDECRDAAYRARNFRKNNKRRNSLVNRDASLEAVIKRDGFDCHICGEPVDLMLARNSRFGATLDHVMPISKGGDSSLENLRLAHWICNIRKSDSLEFVDG